MTNLKKYKNRFRRGEVIEVFKRILNKIGNPNFKPKKVGKVNVNSPEEINYLLGTLIKQEEPFLSVRFGAVELKLFYHLVKCELGIEKNIPNKWKETAFLHAGIFSFDNRSMSAFKTKSIAAMENARVFLVWANYMESFFLKEYKPKIARNYGYLLSYEAYLFEQPWTLSLEGKKVLVVSPFCESIKRQYSIRNKIFDKSILPSFASLETVRAPQTISEDSIPEGKKWIDVYEDLLSECLKKDFDIALIGCGGYGMILANDLFQRGKKAIHLGGVTQTLFGVLGKRWESRDYMKKIINENWIRPSENEKPSNYDKIEGGCYW